MAGRFLLDPATAVTVAFGTTPVGFPVGVPANPALVGSQLSAQAVLSFASMLQTATPVMIAVR